MPFTKEQAKEEVRKLVERYKELVETGDPQELTEEETKKDFILPLFHALNWDTQNSKEVSAEETISKKRVDYGFRIDGIPKLFLETKSLKEKLETEFAEQAINYSWLKSTTWAILTNFIELKIYNAEWRARSPIDKMFFELKWNEFIENFDKLWLLSKDSFLRNELDEKAEEWGKKQKKTPVTPVMKQLFNDLMIWRQRLRNNIVKYKANMEALKTEEALDESIQRILDRLIFIRVCEDRKIEPVELLSRLREWKDNRKGKMFVQLLNEVFREFDENYNSRLFSKHTSEELVMDDMILNDIIHGLYESSDGIFKYDFAAIDADVLGNIYEEYLGHVLKKGRGKVSENNLHRKEMGIFYTPTFIVDYIVKSTLGELLKQKGDGKIKILDPACGSGSFLIKAFATFVDYYGTSKESSFEDKIKILKSNIFGVDLDPKAAEIAQLNLLLRALEKRKHLPMLQNNIKIGNSLIDDVKVVGDKAFDWNKEFKEIMKEGGFDVIVGNPPYIRTHELDKKDKEFFSKKFISAIKQYDIYVLFYELAIKLLKENGKIGFITSNKFTITEYGEKLRKFILDNCIIEQIIDVSNFQVFKSVSTYPYIFILKKESEKEKRDSNKIKFIQVDDEQQLLHNDYEIKSIEQKRLAEIPKNLFIFTIDTKTENILKKVERGERVISIFRARPTTKNIIKNPPDKSNYLPVLTNRDIDFYNYTWNRESYIKKTDKFLIKKPVILVKKICSRLTATYAEDPNIAAVNTVYVVNTKDEKLPIKFLLAIINSKLIDFYTKKLYFPTHMRGGYIELRTFEIQSIPIIKNKKDSQKIIVKLVDKILELNKELQKVGKLSDKGKKLQEEIQKIDKEIDQKVYELYELTPEEIKIVESS